MTTAIPGTSLQDLVQEQIWTPTQAPSVMVLPTDVELRTQALKLALTQQSQNQSQNQQHIHYSEIVKAAEAFYEFLQEGLTQSVGAGNGYAQSLHGQQSNQNQGRRA